MIFNSNLISNLNSRTSKARPASGEIRRTPLKLRVRLRGLSNLILASALASLSCAAPAPREGETFDSVYANKKAEILAEYEKIDTARQELETFRAATLALLRQKEENVLAIEAEANKTLALAAQKEAAAKKMLEHNEEVLKELRDIMAGKVLEVYAKMKDGAAAQIMTELPRMDAARILYHLAPKKIATVLSKIDPATAAEITQLLQQDELFVDKNATDANATK